MALRNRSNRMLVMLGALVVCVYAIIAWFQIHANDHIITVGHAKVHYEIVSTPDTLAKGLSGRSSLASNTGMLFVIDPPQIASFWMKDMHFPLDFIWIKDNKVVDLTEHVAAPLPNTPDEKLIRYQPKTVVDHVLEVNAGFVEYYKIKIGNEVLYN